MIELVIGLAIAVILWRMRKLFYSNLEDFEASLKVAQTEKQLEQQEEIKEMLDLVNEYKTKNGKWYTVKDLDNAKAK